MEQLQQERNQQEPFLKSGQFGITRKFNSHFSEHLREEMVRKSGEHDTIEGR